LIAPQLHLFLLEVNLMEDDEDKELALWLAKLMGCLLFIIPISLI